MQKMKVSEIFETNSIEKLLIYENRFDISRDIINLKNLKYLSIECVQFEDSF